MTHNHRFWGFTSLVYVEKRFFTGKWRAFKMLLNFIQDCSGMSQNRYPVLFTKQ